MEAVHLRPKRQHLGMRLDRIRLQPWIQIGSLHWPAWRFFVLVGIHLGILLIAVLGAASGASFWIAGGVGLAAGLACAAYALFRKVLYGYENYTFYHYQIVVLAMGAVVAGFFQLPVPRYLDFLAMGLATSLAIGRIGCLRAGCCFGRPHQWGVCYREEHGRLGFPSHLLGVRLLPVQMIEAIWLGIVILAGTIMVVSGQPPGSTLSWYLLAYSLGRFALEFVRGDPPRPYWLGISEAQWTSAIVVAVLVFLELIGFLPPQPWHSLGLAILTVTFLLLHHQNQTDNQPTRRQVLHARHIREIAWAVDQAINREGSRQAGDSPAFGKAFITRTSLGLQISGGKIQNDADEMHHYALSALPTNLDPRNVETLARLILQLRYPDGVGEIHPGDHGVFHLFVWESN